MTTVQSQPDTATIVLAERVTREFLQLVPRDFARDHLLLSQGRHDGVERMAVSRATHPCAVRNVGVLMGVAIDAFAADGEVIARTIDQAYETTHGADDPAALAAAPVGGTGGLALDDPTINELLALADRDLLSTQGKGPVVKLVDAILFEALGRRATDVHVQPVADRTLVRYRLDGVLHTAREITRPRHLAAAVISRIKVMSRMDIAERRVPQDGRATVTIGTRCIDLRVSTLPTSHGERAVIRLLDNSQQLHGDFSGLGMPGDLARAYLDRASLPNGIILVTGPTGSGKTTTLYATLKAVGHPGVNILTIEDPIEYDLTAPGAGLSISQSQVNPRKGVNFATGLRHILRQDPDVIMVGEIRDEETARIAIQSSLTGHLVFSTLHTNDAPGAITRLMDLGVEPYLVGASLSAVLAQRLVRLVHQPCGGHGCPDCFQTGYSGRTGVFELLMVDDAMRQLITDRATLSAIRAAARRLGMRSLIEEGRRLVTEGLTTELEVRRVMLGAES